MRVKATLSEKKLNAWNENKDEEWTLVLNYHEKQGDDTRNIKQVSFVPK